MALMHPMYNHSFSSKKKKSKKQAVEPTQQKPLTKQQKWFREQNYKIKSDPYASSTPYIREQEVNCKVVYRSMEDLDNWNTAKKEHDTIIPEDFCIAPAYNKGAYQVVPRTDTDAYRNRK